MKIAIINGPNLNLLGKREPDIYGSQNFESYLEILRKDYPQVEFEYFQSNHEGAIIDKLHEIGFSYDGIVLNAAGYTHTSIAIGDAIRAIQTPVIEVHISDIYKREEYRHISRTEAACIASCVGYGMESYRMAVEALLEYIS